MFPASLCTHTGITVLADEGSDLRCSGGGLIHEACSGARSLSGSPPLCFDEMQSEPASVDARPRASPCTRAEQIRGHHCDRNDEFLSCIAHLWKISLYSLSTKTQSHEGRRFPKAIEPNPKTFKKLNKSINTVHHQ